MKVSNVLIVCGLLGGAVQAIAQPEPPKRPRPPRAPRGITLHEGRTSYLGVGAADVDAERAKALKLSEERGVEIKNVDSESPAAKAGVKEGDVVLEYNGQRVEGTEQFVRLVRETPPGRSVRLLISRDGKTQTITLTTAARTSHFMGGDGFRLNVPVPPVPPFPPSGNWWQGMAPDLPTGNMTWRSGSLGIESESLGPQLAQFFGVKDGVLVRSVNKNSPAEKAGIKAGDVIVKINGNAVESPREIGRELRQGRRQANVSITLVRDRKEMTVTVTVGEATGNRAAIPVADFC
jgi:serine protease Do